MVGNGNLRKVCEKKVRLNTGMFRGFHKSNPANSIKFFDSNIADFQSSSEVTRAVEPGCQRVLVQVEITAIVV